MVKIILMLLSFSMAHGQVESFVLKREHDDMTFRHQKSIRFLNTHMYLVSNSNTTCPEHSEVYLGESKMIVNETDLGLKHFLEQGFKRLPVTSLRQVPGKNHLPHYFINTKMIPTDSALISTMDILLKHHCDNKRLQFINGVKVQKREMSLELTYYSGGKKKTSTIRRLSESCLKKDSHWICLIPKYGQVYLF